LTPRSRQPNHAMSEPQDNVETIEAPKTEAVVPRRAPATKPNTAAKPRGTSYAPKAPTIPKPPKTVEADEDDESFFQRNRVAIIFGVVLLAGGGWYFLGKPAGKSEAPSKPREQRMVMVIPPPPPPPLPTPPPVVPKIPPPPTEKKAEMAPVDKPAEKAPVEKPAEKPPESLGTSIKGGEGMAGLSLGGGNGMIGGTGDGPGGGGDSAGKQYAWRMKEKIAEALRNNRKTRSATMRVEAQVWVDPSGRISRATLDRSTGDQSLDQALTGEILPGIQISEPPPQGMRMPIPYRFTARRPQ
jgi:periplasmic protein TonB